METFPYVPIPENFSYGSIYQHIIASAKVTSVTDIDDSENDECDFNTSKPMVKGRLYYTSGHITDMQDAKYSGHYFLKSKVRASFRKCLYRVSGTLCNNGQVIYSSCECKASAMGRCSHISGLLFALEDYTLNFGYQSASFTIKLCAWNVGRKRSNNPQPAHAVKYSKKAAPDRIIFHDPRPDASSTSTSQAEQDFENSFISQLSDVQSWKYNIFGHCGPIAISKMAPGQKGENYCHQL